MFKYQLSTDSIFGYAFCTHDKIDEEDLIDIIIQEYCKINEFDASKIVESLIKNDYRFRKVPDSHKFDSFDCKIIMIDDNDIISFNIMKRQITLIRGAF